ncbi:MAG: hypothetical protein IH628_08070 [Proteobacteria bacterium]|nr:hypothetical protein [Pseudomonadota bacterium]
MNDVSRKTLQQHSAEAQVLVGLSRAGLARLKENQDRLAALRSEALAIASLAAKNHAAVFPKAHQALVDGVDCRLEPIGGGIRISVSVKALSKTDLRGLARYAAACAGVFVVGHLEAEDPEARVTELTILRSEGGRKPIAASFPEPLTAAVVVLSDSRSTGAQADESGPLIRQRLESHGMRVLETVVIPDDSERFEELLRQFADVRKLDCIVTTGGTGIGPRDAAPEVTRDFIDREIPGVSEAIRAYGQERTPFSMLSRGVAGVRGRTLIVNLPGAPSGVSESLDAVMPELLHVFKMMAGGGHP